MRNDIQFLRGLAVLAVVLYHADFGVAGNGYLGVDIFFVISGFLITSIILRQLEQKTFSFSAFYMRRAKRLLPALYATLSATSLLAYFFISSTQLDEYVSQLVGAITFSANMVLPTQVGYFAGAAESKPLLHIWSLSLEEQYYFFLPLFLFLIPARYRLPALLSLVTVSLLWCISWASSSGELPPFLWRYADASKAEWAFYLFPTRAWELLAGSVAAWMMLRRPGLQVHANIKIMALVILLLMVLFGVDRVHPRWDAVIVTLATMIIMLDSRKWLPETGAIRIVERVGDWSYSVYLVHWPLFTFAYLGFVGDIPADVKILIVALSILFGFIQYRYIETPFRYGWSSRPRVAWSWFTASSLAVLSIPVPMVLGEPAPAVNAGEVMRRINYGLSEDCDGRLEGSWVPKVCSTTDQPDTAVWGDSFAMHLVPGLKTGTQGLVQVTKSACGPVAELAPITGKYTKSWAKTCVAFNDAALQGILAKKSITKVVMSSTFGQYFDGDQEGMFLLDGKVVEKDPSVAIERFVETIRKLQRNGKRVLIVSPPPRSGFDVGECLEREESSLVLFRPECEISVDDYYSYEKSITDSLKTIAARTNAEVIWLKDLLCDEEKCRVRIGDAYLYRDGGHLSIEGSRRLLGQVKL